MQRTANTVLAETHDLIAAEKLEQMRVGQWTEGHHNHDSPFYTVPCTDDAMAPIGLVIVAPSSPSTCGNLSVSQIIVISGPQTAETRSRPPSQRVSDPEYHKKRFGQRRD